MTSPQTPNPVTTTELSPSGAREERGVSSPNEPDDTKATGSGKDTAVPASSPGSWVAEAAASAVRSAESGETPPWQRAAARGGHARPTEAVTRAGAESGARPTEVIRTVEPGRTEDASRAIVVNRPAESAGQTAVTRVVEPTSAAAARGAVTPGVPATPAVAPQAGERPAATPPPVAPPAPDHRVNRYVTGTAAPTALQQLKSTESEPARTEVARPKDAKEVGSELPNLSGTPARALQRSEAPAAPPRSRIQVGARTNGGPMRASMQIRRVDPWSALKVSLLLSVAMFFVWMIAVAFLYLVLGGMGVWTKLNSNVGDLLTSNSGAGGELVSAGSIFGGALLIGLVNIVLLTAMATIGAFVYNMATDIVGGVEVTLADRD
jgi:Transmembrane domain of unknown function (DUF3566)